MGFKIQQKVYEVLPTGDYPAEIESIELTDGQFGQQLKFTFSLIGKPQSLWGWASASFTTKSKLYAWTRAAFGGRPIPPNYTLDTDDLIGKPVVLTVVVSTKDDGAEYNKIENVRPYLNGNGQQPAMSQPTVTPEQAAMNPRPVYMGGDSF